LSNQIQFSLGIFLIKSDSCRWILPPTNEGRDLGGIATYEIEHNFAKKNRPLLSREEMGKKDGCSISFD